MVGGGDAVDRNAIAFGALPVAIGQSRVIHAAGTAAGVGQSNARRVVKRVLPGGFELCQTGLRLARVTEE